VVTPDVPDGVLVCLALGVGLTIRPGEPKKEVQIVQFQLSFKSNGCIYNLIPRAFPHPFFKGKALGTRLLHLYRAIFV